MALKENFNYKSCCKSEEDFNLLRKIHITCMKEKVIASLGEWNEEQQKNRITRHFNQYGDTLKFVYLEKELIGTVNLHLQPFDINGLKKEVLFFEQLYILPAYQGRGYGKKIMAEMKNLCAKEDEEIRLSVLKDDIKTQRFYEKLGYKMYDKDQWQVYFQLLPEMTVKAIKKPSI